MPFVRFFELWSSFQNWYLVHLPELDTLVRFFFLEINYSMLSLATVEDLHPQLRFNVSMSTFDYISNVAEDLRKQCLASGF